MKIIHRATRLLAICSCMLIAFTACKQGNNSDTRNQEDSSTYYTTDDFYRVEKFDTHTHFNIFDTSFFQQAAADNFRLITVNVNPYYYPPIKEQLDIASRLIRLYPERISFATTFSMAGYDQKSWQQNTLAYLKQSFARGAIAVKVWKNIGMDIKERDGKFLMIDNPLFDPIFDFLEKNNIPVIGHLGEPRNCWLPVEQMTVKGDKDYFSSHPQYHMYLHPEYPTYEEQVRARDHMLEKHPNLLFVGAHLGSLEWSVDELAKRLDTFPNMAVDMAQRISHLQYQAVTEWQKVHDFIIKYQDRLVYATDTQVDSSGTAAQRNRNAHEIWLRHWLFFTSGDTMKVPKVEKEFRGMRLPREVVDKIYSKNARKWFPGISDPSKYLSVK